MIDLHSHSDRSDGALGPAALVRRAASRGVEVLALTDHDTLAGLEEASGEARDLGLRLVPGVEVSVTWSGRTLHVVGLGVDPCATALAAGLATVRHGRLQRARAISERLNTIGVRHSLDGVLALAANREMVSRTHFARHLVAIGACKDMPTAFRRFLGDGKPGFVRHTWASLSDAVAWIGGAGGVAVLAHPGRYALKPRRMLELFCEFKSLGGVAAEVVSGTHSAEQTREAARLAGEAGLLASAGSDFHSPEESWLDLGRLDPLPSQCRPVWEHLRLTHLH